MARAFHKAVDDASGFGGVGWHAYSVAKLFDLTDTRVADDRPQTLTLLVRYLIAVKFLISATCYLLHLSSDLAVYQALSGKRFVFASVARDHPHEVSVWYYFG